MIGMLRRAVDTFRGGGEASITVPPMDGALRSNDDLERARVVFEAAAADNIAAEGSSAIFSSGRQVLKLDLGNRCGVIAEFGSRVTALAIRNDLIAVGLAGGGVSLLDKDSNETRFEATARFPNNCPTALSFTDTGELLIANGSSEFGPDFWKHDLMSLNAKGSVWKLNLRERTEEKLIGGLGYPNGVLALAGGRIVVSEAWRSRLVTVDGGRAPLPVLTDLPGYPGRITTAGAKGGFWLPLFAPRRRIVELVLREHSYRKRMMAEIPSDYWISPSLRPMSSYLEPLQGGTLKKLARLKPWAPSRSYGLVVRLDQDFQPTGSFHSRADGTRHGISSCAVWGSRLLAAATGGDVVVEIDTTGF